MPKEWKARQGEELQEHLAFAAAKDERAGRVTTVTSKRGKQSRCTRGKSVKGLCVQDWVPVHEALDPRCTTPLDYAAHYMRTLPERIQAVIDAGRELGLELEDYRP